MMGFGFWELALVGLVGLLVLGPERLPSAARTLGAYLRRARQTWAGLRHEIERELAAEELRRTLRDQPASSAEPVARRDPGSPGQPTSAPDPAATPASEPGDGQPPRT